MGACSLIATTPLLDIRDFDWTQMLRDQWQAIRAEALRGDVTVSAPQCPATAAAIRSIPGLHAVRLQRISPGRSRPNRMFAERALLTCHLGLIVPRGGDLRMRLAERTVRWAEGETLLFDGSRAGEWYNDGSDSGLLLSVQLRRPLSRPGRWIADALLRGGR